MAELTMLFRPVGQKEYDLIARSGFREFPPWLPGQPIFYPVLTLEYAIEIARDWNTKDQANGSVGYVTRFQVDREYLARFPVERVGGSPHVELWIPADELPSFNSKIVGLIEVIHEFHGE